MSLQSLTSLINRVLFFGSFLLFALAIVEKMANLSGQTVIKGAYAPGRLFEFAAVVLLFVIALLLRNIREELRASG